MRQRTVEQQEIDDNSMTSLRLFEQFVAFGSQKEKHRHAAKVRTRFPGLLAELGLA